ncbi:hypothetical protein DET50_11752 [Marinobacter pelagius]|uniref:Uncharacterized protein n=1 Tax=Marinobacter pelagius TaxID=379482 RepID=A0A366GJM8_9GAMM|nr:hypothetical protein DET50_11752 [Marinobacter pelagius]
MGGPAELGKVPVRLEKIQSWETRLKMGSDEQVHLTPEYVAWGLKKAFF